MAGVDDKVVSMQFDNAQFEAKLGQTLAGLDKLNRSLDFTQAQNNLSGLSAAGNKFSMGNMASKVDEVGARFSALAIGAGVVLGGIASKAISAGSQLVKSFTLAPIEAGFQNFSTKMTSISTILANTQSKGTTLTNVQDALASLNTYAQQTIYDFSDMTKNLGTFTAAGVDLNTSKEAIKGIANMAAISGSNTDQASMAMYQLSQAMAAGQVKLQDWNSVVNAGMGGQVFQKALFNTGVALKTIPGIPVGETFDQWTAKGNSFRNSLDKGWLTTKVLTTTLNAATGDFSTAQLKSMGYTQQQAEQMAQLGKTGLAAATQIKTVKALMDMLKEGAAAGWSQTFSILGGSYDETVKLLTTVGNYFNDILNKASDARNKLLQGWADLGGRTSLIDGIRSAWTALTDVLKTVGEAFRSVFPATTSKQLYDTTRWFQEFAKSLIPSKATLAELKNLFVGVFSVLKIGETIVIDVISVFTNLLHDVLGGGAAGGVLKLGSNFGLLLQHLENLLVTQRGIANFFGAVNQGVDKAVAAVKMAVEWFAHLFGSASSGSDSGGLSKLGRDADAAKGSISLLEAILQRMEARYNEVAGLFRGSNSVFSWLAGIATVIGAGLAKAGQAIHQWFATLGQQIAASLKPGDFDGAVGAVNVGLLGGILLLLKKFMNNMKSFDLTGGMMDSIKTALGGVTGQLKAMQAELKAKALEEIAIALGVLTVSIVALSLINPANLTKAMSAMAVGMGELVAAMALMNHISSGTMDSAKFTILATGMTIMASAVLVLSAAVAVMAHLSWAELSRGLTGVTAVLTMLVVTARVMEGSATGMVAAGLAMIPLATGLTIMAAAVTAFGHMSWETMGKGLLGLAGTLLIVVGAMKLMDPVAVLATGLAMIPLATGITILAGALRVFGTMSLAEIGKGLVALAGALAIIAVAVNLMPVTLPIIAVGLVGVGVALTIMAGAVRLFGGMSWGEILKGLTAIAGLMVILAVGVNAMVGALPGAAAMIVVAGALVILTDVLKTLGTLSIGDLIQGLLGMAGVFVVLGVAGVVLAPIVPALLGLGIAMTLVGVGFALFGAGALLVGKAVGAFAEATTKGIEAVITSINLFIKAIPMFISTFVGSLEKSAGDVAKSTAVMLKLFTVLLGQILDTIIKMAPKIGAALVVLITNGLALIRKVFPDAAITIVDLLTVLLKTLGEHTPDIVQAAVTLIVTFSNTMANNAQKLVDAAVHLITSFLTAIGNRAGDIVGAGTNVLVQFLNGIANNITKVSDAATNIVTEFIASLGNDYLRIINAGTSVIVHLITGIGDDAGKIAAAGTDALIKFLSGITDDVLKITNAMGDLLVKLLNGIADAIRTHTKAINDAGGNIASAIIDGLVYGIQHDGGAVVQAIKDMAGGVVGTFLKIITARSPSRLFMTFGGYITQGLALGIRNDTSAEESVIEKANAIVGSFQRSLTKMSSVLGEMDEFSPRITPVLDLSKVQAGARTLGEMFSTSEIAPRVSLIHAGVIATTADVVGKQPVDPLANQAPKQVVFNQTINSPRPLSTEDIYKNTNSQIARAKEELNI